MEMVVGKNRIRIFATSNNLFEDRSFFEEILGLEKAGDSIPCVLTVDRWNPGYFYLEIKKP
jgi:hypothetical protein